MEKWIDKKLEEFEERFCEYLGEHEITTSEGWYIKQEIKENPHKIKSFIRQILKELTEKLKLKERSPSEGGYNGAVYKLEEKIKRLGLTKQNNVQKNKIREVIEEMEIWSGMEELVEKSEERIRQSMTGHTCGQERGGDPRLFASSDCKGCFPDTQQHYRNAAEAVVFLTNCLWMRKLREVIGEEEKQNSIPF